MDIHSAKRRALAHAGLVAATRERPVELRHYFSILRRRLVLIAVTVAVAASVAWIRTPQTPVYKARATLYVGARQFPISTQGQVAGSGVLTDALALAERLQLTFASMIRSEPVAEAALAQTKLQRSAPSVVQETSVGPIKDTQLLEIVVTDKDPAVARDLANALARAFVDKVQNFEPAIPAQEGSVPALPAYVFQDAKLPTGAEPNGLGRNVILAALFGLLLAGGIAFLLEYLDLTIKSPIDAERRLGLPVLGIVPMQRPTAAAVVRRLPRESAA